MTSAQKSWAKKSELFGWCFFDVANSSYTTIIITVAYNVIFAQLIVGKGDNPENPYSLGNLLWSIVLAISWSLTALSSPLVGAVTDSAGRKKLALAISVAICSIGTVALYLPNPGQIWFASALIILTNIAFSFSENFISAFLPHICPPEKIGTVSGWGWGIGYLGGLASIIVCGTLITFDFASGNYDKLRLVGPLTGVFFIIASIPTFLFVREPGAKTSPVNFSQSIQEGYQTLRKTLRGLPSQRNLLYFFFSYFFFQAGVSIVISFAALYGQQEVGVSGQQFILFFVTLQLTAALGSILFGFLQDKWGPLQALNLTLWIWIATVIAVFSLNDIARLFGIKNVVLLFIVLSNGAGLCLGATQACARTLVGVLSPAESSGQFYGFWGFFGKFAAVFGVLAFGIFQSLFTLRMAILLCSSFFAVSLWMNRHIRVSSNKEPS